MIADTILIKEDENEILTKNLSSEWEEISYNLEDSDVEESQKKQDNDQNEINQNLQSRRSRRNAIKSAYQSTNLNI